MNQQLAPIESFAQSFNSPRNVEALQKCLGKDVSLDAFTRVVMRAVQENPELLQADQKSLFFACERAAQDKLLPDGKDGYLGVYNTNVGTRDNPQWVKKVQWHPMIEGMRKILALHKISLRAELVYENDEFSYEKGDNPILIHKCDVFSPNRGDMIGGYAIATDMQTGQIIAREAMAAAELENVRQASKNPNGGVWKKWPGQMYRKAPARRLFATVPKISALLATVIENDNATFDLNKPAEPTAAAKDVQAAVRLAAPNPEMKLEPAPEERVEVIRGQLDVMKYYEATANDVPVTDIPPTASEQVPLSEYAGSEPDF